MPLHDSGRARLLASRGIIRLGRRLALPRSRKAIENVEESNRFESRKKRN
jgi:hypothetical protein